MTKRVNQWRWRLPSMTDGTGTTHYTYVPIGSLGALRLQQDLADKLESV